MKTINFELSKRLNDKWLLDNIETEYCYFEWRYIAWDNKEYICDKLQLTPYFDWIKESISSQYKLYYDDFTITIIKTLTLEEAIGILPEYINEDYELSISKNRVRYIDLRWPSTFILFNDEWDCFWTADFEWKTLLEAIKKMIEYLLDNNLIRN